MCFGCVNSEQLPGVAIESAERYCRMSPVGR